uniref:Uncharacterized protein n=1 Tax=viral metagenome TaxID=1070528 RepID=A0A6C0C2B3_9ZZZZ
MQIQLKNELMHAIDDLLKIDFEYPFKINLALRRNKYEIVLFSCSNQSIDSPACVK